jgi:hypothetical protein
MKPYKAGMKPHLHLTLLLGFFIPSLLYAQKINGYVVTEQNVMIKGELKILADQYGKKISVNDGKSYFTRTFYLRELKAYAYKKDTFAILNAFHPFEGEDYLAENLEAKVLISKGPLKLYYATLPDYSITYINTGYPGSGAYTRTNYKTYVINYSGNLYGVKNGDTQSFVKSISIALADNETLLKRIRNNEFKYKDMEKIIALYNASWN